jgi:hypothetical protein
MEKRTDTSSSFWIRNNKSIPKIVIQKSIKMIQHFLMSFFV